jgi:hypothetical protein
VQRTSAPGLTFGRGAREYEVAIAELSPPERSALIEGTHVSLNTAPTLSPDEERPRTLQEAKAWMMDRARKQIHPMNNLSVEDTAAAVDRLDGLDGASWARAWRVAGEQAWDEAKAAEATGDAEAARRHFTRADGFFFLGRFPCPNHPDKLACAERERDAYLKLGEAMDPPLRRVAIPFPRAEGEGNEVVFYYRRPKEVARPPIVVMWGGVDAWKEQMTAASDAVLAQGVATIALDNAGTGESPVVGRPGAERQFLAVFDWIAQQSDLAGRPVCLGRSFGGYWATLLAHCYAERIAGAVNWGGGVHYMFQPEWIGRSRYPDSYLMELVETRQRMLGAANWNEYLEGFRRLSLLDAGVLDAPCAPLLLVNGREDKQCPVADIDLLLGHGSPKAVRLFPGGHMGLTPETLPTIVNWTCTLAKMEASR